MRLSDNATFVLVMLVIGLPCMLGVIGSSCTGGNSISPGGCAVACLPRNDRVGDTQFVCLRHRATNPGRQQMNVPIQPQLRLRLVEGGAGSRECVNPDRVMPCAHTGCFWHMSTLYVAPRGRPSHVERSEETCVLEVADLRGQSLDEVGRHIGVSRERIRQLEVEAVNNLPEWAKEVLAEFVDHVRSAQSLAEQFEADVVPDARGAYSSDYAPDAEADQDIERWSNEVVAGLRAGMTARDAWRAANEAPDEIGDEDAAVNLYV